MIHTNSKIAQICDLRSDHHIHNYVQVSQVELTHVLVSNGHHFKEQMK